ncbi:MAG: hypothetical protein HYV07_23245 [Deltaproteobacteria bacterium]|nr:hypothetical protein [Deltaproteobacteria bacterium]
MTPAPTEAPGRERGRKLEQPLGRASAARASQTEPFEDEATEILADAPPSRSSPGFVPSRSKPDKPSTPRFETTERVVRAPKGARPRGAMGQKGTKAAAAMAHKLHVDRMVDDNMPSTRAPLLRLIATHVSKAHLTILEDVLLGKFESRREGDAPSSPKRNLERLIHDVEFVALEPRAQAAVLASVADDAMDSDTIRAVTKLVSSGVLGRLSSTDRRLLLELLSALPGRDRRLLAAIADRPLRRKTALEDRDVEDGSLVASLHGYILGTELDRRVEAAGLSRESAALLVLSTLANPERMPIEDGASGVLGILEFALAETSPAEWLRLWVRFSSGELVAELPSRGSLDLAERFTLGPVAFAESETPLRLGLELVAGLAHPRTGPTREAFAMPGGHGVDVDIVARALGLIYGIEYSVFAGARAARRALEGANPLPHRSPPAFVTLLYEGGERLFVFDHLAERIYLRSPHGTSTKPKGALRMDPARVVEDPSRSLESLDLDEFERAVGVAIIPRS